MTLLRLRDRFREMRRSPRHEIHYLAQIDAGHDQGQISCMIANISELGAKLTVGAHQAVPEEFTLVFRRRCRIVRRIDSQIGVEFVAGG
jgi:PilZ domain